METEAPPSVGLYNFLGWFETKKKLLVQIGVGALVAAAVIGFLVWRSSQKQIEAEQALAGIRMPFSPSDLPAPGTGDALAKIATEYPGTPAAAKATLRAASVYFGEGNYAKAKDQFDLFIRNHSDSPWISQAIYGLATCLDAQGNVPEAIAKYEAFIKTPGSDILGDQARLNLARLYEQNKQPEQALELLNKMTSAQQGYSPAAAEVQEKIRELYTKYPKLVPTPTPPPSIPPQIMAPTIVTPGTNGPAAPRILQPAPQPTPGK